MKKLLTAILGLVLFLSVVLFTACSSQGGGESLSEDDIAKLTEAANAEYINVLKDNKDVINDYTWQASTDTTFKQISRQVAITDINGDEVPELLFFAHNNSKEPKAELMIYSYGTDGLAEMSYSFQDGKMIDDANGAGCSYVVYLGDDGRFYIYKSVGAEEFTATVASYVFNGPELTREYEIVKNDSIIVGDNGLFMGLDETFTIDGDLVDTSKGEKKFNAAVNGLKTAVIHSGYDGTDLFKSFNQDETACMSYDDALKSLSSK